MVELSVEYLNENNVWVDLDDWCRPIINKSTLNQTHDETHLTLIESKIEKPFMPLTKFIINVTERDNDTNEIISHETLYRVVVRDDFDQVSFHEEERYNHDIWLMEPTKLLERYTVDNISLTNEWAKAFIQTKSPFFIKDFTIHNNWYTKDYYFMDVVESLGYVYYYYYQMISQYNELDAYGAVISPVLPRQETFPSIQETYIYKKLNDYNYPADYSFSHTLLDKEIVGNYIKIPNITISNIPTYHIAYYPFGGDFIKLYKYDAFIIFWSNLRKVEVISPSGEIINTAVNENVQLNETGRYRVRYTVDRHISSLLTERRRSDEKLIKEYYSPTQLGSTAIIEIEVFSYTSLIETTDKLSVYDVLNKLINTVPTRFKEDTRLEFSLFDDGTDNSIFNRYAKVIAPEMVFTGKNLWECLCEVGGIINAIPYLRISDKNNWNVIDFFPLSSEKRVDDTVEENYSNSTSYYDGDNFTGAYDLFIENMISPVSSIDGYVSEGGYKIGKSVRSEEVEISSTSMNIETVYPIYKVNKLYYLDVKNNNNRIDITSDLQELALYEVQESASIDSGKATMIYYQQGKKNIMGLQYKVSKNDYKDAVSVVTIKKIIKKATSSLTELNDIEILSAKFIIEYIPFLNARIRIYKPNSPKIGIDTSMFQNQTANVVDARALGRKMTANISMTGNLGYIDSVRVFGLKNIPKKGERSDDGYFVSTVTTEFDKYDILSSIEYTKDYQKINEWINIHNLQRYYEVSEKQSINRYVNTHMFYVYGDAIAELYKENGLNMAVGYPTKNYLYDILIGSGNNRIINASILTAYSATYFITDDIKYKENKRYFISPTFKNYILLEEGIDYQVDDIIPEIPIVYNITNGIISRIYLNSNAIAVGNNISIITDYENNYGAGYQAKKYNISGDTWAMMNRSIPYSDNFGKIDHLLVENITDSNIDYSSGSGNATLNSNIERLALSLPAINEIDTVTLKPKGLNYIRIADSYSNSFPLPTFSAIGCKQDINLLKDSREVIHLNQQHHFLVNDERVVLGALMTEACRYIQDINYSYRLVFLKNKIDMYEFKIKEEDIIILSKPLDSGIEAIYNKINSLCTGINSSNYMDILSTDNNSDIVYLQPSLQNGGYIVGLTERAYAWAIITDDNELLIGKNEIIEKDYLSGINVIATPIYQSVTKEY